MISTHTPSYTENLAHIQNLRGQLAANNAECQTFAEQAEAAERGGGDIGSMIDAVAAGGELAEPATAAEFRRKVDVATTKSRILDGAISKLDKLIQAQQAERSHQYAKLRLPEQQRRVHRTLDALLDLAEVSAEERAMRSAAEGEGCPGHYFPAIAFVINGGPLTGSFHAEKQHLAALFEKYVVMGFVPNAAQTKRLAALPD